MERTDLANSIFNDGGDDLAALGHPDAAVDTSKPHFVEERPDPLPEPAVEAEAEAAPAAEQPAAEQPGEEKPPQGYIPASRYKEVREKQKAAEKAAAEALAAAQSMRARLEALERGQQAPQAPQAVAAPEKPDPEPDKTQNYVEWLEWRDRQNEKRFREVETWRQQQAQAEQAQSERMQLAAAIAPQIQQYRAEVTDYDAGLEFARNRIAQQVVTAGYNPAMAPQAIETFETQLASFATAWGINPAPLMYAAAKAWGYGAKSEADDDGIEVDTTERPRDDKGRFVPQQPVAPAAPPKPVPKSLGNAAGAATGGKITLSDWNRMSDREQTAILKRDPTFENRLLRGAA